MEDNIDKTTITAPDRLDYIYEIRRLAPTEAVINHYTKAAENDQIVLLKQFQNFNHLSEYDNADYLPDTFLVQTNEIQYLKTYLFENVARAERQDFDRIQKNIKDALDDIANRIDQCAERIEDIKKHQIELKDALKSTKVVDDKLFYEHRIETNKAALKNFAVEKADLENQQDDLNSHYAKNAQVWENQQLPMIKKCAESTIEAYVKLAVNLIEHQYGFTNFKFVPIEIESLPADILSAKERKNEKF